MIPKHRKPGPSFYRVLPTTFAAKGPNKNSLARYPEPCRTKPRRFTFSSFRLTWLQISRPPGRTEQGHDESLRKDQRSSTWTAAAERLEKSAAYTSFRLYQIGCARERQNLYDYTHAVARKTFISCWFLHLKASYAS